MRDRLVSLLETADLALASSAGVIDEDVLDPLINSVRAVRTRLAYPDQVLVVGLAGGTGSGKSSLLNAFTGLELVDTGGVRPTTSHPAAAIPSSVGGALDGYLDRLGVDERHIYDGPGICLLDLPDTDSVEVEHRHRVDVILPLVDLVIWVTDPEKYRDSRLHDDYLKPMSSYSDQLLFVLNQIDRLGPAQADQVFDDLADALGEDDIERPIVVRMAVAPPSGPPMGVEELAGVLEDKRSDRQNLYGKLLSDLATTSRSLGSGAGSGLDFDERARQAVATAADRLAADDPAGAGGALIRLLDRLGEECGGSAAVKLAGLAADVPSHVRRIEGELSESGRSKPRGWLRRRHSEVDVADRARQLLSEAVIRPARAALTRRALAIASIADLALEVESLSFESSR